MTTHAQCLAGADFIGDTEERHKLLAESGQRAAITEFDYCWECANEKFRGKLDSQLPIRSGGGHGSRDDDDPGQTNGIRDMER